LGVGSWELGVGSWELTTGNTKKAQSTQSKGIVIFVRKFRFESQKVLKLTFGLIQGRA